LSVRVQAIQTSQYRNGLSVGFRSFDRQHQSTAALSFNGSVAPDLPITWRKRTLEVRRRRPTLTPIGRELYCWSKTLANFASSHDAACSCSESRSSPH
jgi:hypothetical protein